MCLAWEGSGIPNRAKTYNGAAIGITRFGSDDKTAFKDIECISNTTPISTY
jgi:hypothetical protein